MYGTLYGSGLSVLIVGVPTYDPTIFELPPSSATWTHSAWNFFPTPSSLASGSGVWSGIPSPCTGCSIAKMFTISPANFTNDTSCFGLCGLNQVPDARWDQVVMGELVLPCSQTPSVSATCTIQYTSNGSWYGGTDNGGGGALTSGLIRYSTTDVNQGLEGIELGRPAEYPSAYTVPPGTFNPLVPVPIPTPTTRPKCPVGCVCSSNAPKQQSLGILPNSACPM